ncbi:probable cyclic nucleotide-gated ion channel 16 [Solanum stenotomum]|uniref:probable cyclic nucleotide-gated ion channel 16 n=1 Tax=Solanum stenotomum TaxID=172797 RepID=UPI0020D03992|nr:probable cyclic nucleotide-gated ion channel 16 [Solanum stenotomum]
MNSLLEHLNRFKNSLIYDQQKPFWKQIHDPNGEFVGRWNHIFLFTSFVGLFVDPLFLLLPIIIDTCMGTDNLLGYAIIVFRLMVDCFACFQIYLKFRTAFVSKKTRVFGKGELVMDRRLIAIRYLKNAFVIDVAAALPLPQIVIWFIMPLNGSSPSHANHSISLIIMLQYVPRLLVIFPLNSKIIKNTGVVAKTAWSGAAYNLLLYLLASHVLGAIWYLMSIERHFSCWKDECVKKKKGSPNCNKDYLDCSSLNKPGRQEWSETTEVFNSCDATRDITFEFGMFGDANTERVTSAGFFDRYFYCLWWGLKSLSSYAQSITTSTNIVETLLSSLICLLGLVFFALLIGNMQSYLQSMTARLEQWRVKRRDTEEWMRHRQLPEDLQDRVRRFVQYKWLATRGVEEEEILLSLPLDLRRQIQRHLCLALVRRVPFFSQMDDQLLDAICECLVSSLNTKDTFIVREGDPVNEMLFIIRGQLESSTTNGGRSGFFNSITLNPGDFCGEELLTWALVPNPNLNLPSSTRTVKCLTEVEAFALRAEKLKFVANQFRRLHSKKLQHAFRYYSHQWRTWGACYIQAAWRRHRRKILGEELSREESLYYRGGMDQDDDYGREYPVAGGNVPYQATESSTQQLGATILASRFAANTRRGKVARVDTGESSLRMPKLFKPDEPDFSDDPSH